MNEYNNNPFNGLVKINITDITVITPFILSHRQHQIGLNSKLIANHKIKWMMSTSFLS